MFMFFVFFSVTLQVLYKLKTAKLFNKNKCRSPDADDDPFAVQHIYLCADSRMLCVGGFTHVMLFKFSRQESAVDCPVRCPVFQSQENLKTH